MYMMLEIIFTLLLACGVFFGGLFFVRVYQQSPGHSEEEDDNGDDDDEDCLGFEDLRTNKYTGDTVVENAGIERWEAIQEGKDVKQHFIKYGLKGIKSVLRQNMNAWKSKPLNIAVTGESGKGKSSFINAFRGLSAGDIGAAEIDEEECTRDCRPFRHPRYDSFVLWDVPGVGTNEFPKEKYLNAIKVDRFDFFMIIFSARFSELDSWLAGEIKKRKKGFYFIRTKIDIDMENKRKRFGKRGLDFSENEEFQKMKSEVSQKLHHVFQEENIHFFMISNYHPDKYDFPSILDQLLLDVPAEKIGAMVFGLGGMPKNILEEKASALKSRIWKVALLSGVGAGNLVPFVSAGIDTALILEEILFYRKQFGLDDQSLEHLALMVGTSLKDLKSSVEFRTPQKLFTSAGLAKFFTKYAVREVGKTVVKYTIPVVGVAISCGVSFSTTMGILDCLIETMKQDALNVLVYVTTSRETVV
ncbi:interferon-inducible GTPase 5-like [Mercenaria mercenaria]|uniref:interferon-inducible GTPase 5-like n=1 Tax=Mercenaria mercenaria TaxID=6596 RepID=UPI00234ED819|nr:interferon-inducible GTPase 5-like [Mercenaria mercenaria]